MMPLYAVGFLHFTGLVEAIDADDAGGFIEREAGRMNGPFTVERATDKDVSWFKAMGGGHIYQTSKYRAAQKEDA